MSESNNGAARRLERLRRVLAGRQARLASAMAEPPTRTRAPALLGHLRRYGYPVALILVATAVLPTAVSFTWRRRSLLIGAMKNAWALRKLRNDFESAQPTESGR